MRLSSCLRLVALILAAAGSAGGYWLAHHPPAPLRTVALGFQPTNFTLDERGDRLYATIAFSAAPLTILDTRSDDPVPLRGALAAFVATPTLDYRSGHYFGSTAQPGPFLMADLHSGALLKAIPLPRSGRPIMDTVDAARDRQMLVFGQSAALVVLDGNGRLVRTSHGCLAASALVQSAATGRLFEPCVDGSMVVFDARSYRPLAHLPPLPAAFCTGWSMQVDDRTRRLFALTDGGLGVLDARTGTPLRILPVQTWNGGSLAVLPRSTAVVTVPYRDYDLKQPQEEVLVLDGTTGTIRTRWRVPANPLYVLVNPLTGHVLVVSAGPVDGLGAPLGHGTLSVLDARTGRTVQTVAMGYLPGYMVADRRTQHLFVVNYNATMDFQTIVRRYPDGTLPQVLRRAKMVAPWLPFTPPAQPVPPAHATVMMFDLTQF